ncbi:MAG: hypothetical protein CL609_17080 [Anaerolineaceae bacterium]|nr:hypothetical protein [Anaerolineaceae bacterium]
MDKVGQNQPPISLVINGEIWIQVNNFQDSREYDRHFMTKRLENGHEVFIFGNGKNGSRPGDRFALSLKQTKSDPELNGQLGNMNLNSNPSEKLKGIYRAVIMNNEDPEENLRLHVKIDAIPEMGLLWASPILPSKDKNLVIPSVGDIVWISFKEGDPQQPLWLGKINDEV